MPTNRIVVEFQNGAAECKVWDAAGVEHDCSAIFAEIRDRTDQARESATLALRANGLSTSVGFQSTKKELTFDVDSAVIEQIKQML